MRKIVACSLFAALLAPLQPVNKPRRSRRGYLAALLAARNQAPTQGSVNRGNVAAGATGRGGYVDQFNGAIVKAGGSVVYNGISACSVTIVVVMCC
jgi:hypothetical protein